jgi:hypothetical protein
MRFIFFMLLMTVLVAFTGCMPVVTDYTPNQPSSGTTTLTRPALKAPEISTLNVNRTTLSKSGLNLAVQAQIINPNLIDLDLDRVDLTVLNARGENQASKTSPGGTLKSGSVKVFDFDVLLASQSLSERDMTLKIETKTLNSTPEFPLNSVTVINIPSILEQLMFKPQMTFQTKIIGIRQEAANFQGINYQLETQVEGNISNPNPLDIRCDQILITLKNNYGEVLAQDSKPGSPIVASSAIPFKSSLMVPISILNNTELTASVEATTNVNYNNYTLKSTYAIPIPKLKDIIIVPKMTLTAESEWLMNPSAPLRKATITASIPNDNSFNLAVGDYQYNITKPDGTSIYSYTMLSSQIMGIPMNGTRTIIDWPTFGTSVLGFASQDTIVLANIKIGLPGVNEQIPLTANLVFKLPPYR